jgi:HSP20 family protein
MVASVSNVVMARHITEHLTRSVAYLNLDTPGNHTCWTPNTDVYETPELLIVKMELAGILKDDLEITLLDRLLVVRGFRRETCPHRQTRCSFRQMEIDYGYFERRLLLSSVVDAASAQTRFQNGILHIELPKTSRSAQTAVTVVIEQIS